MRRLKDSTIETRAARARLVAGQTPYFRAVNPDLHLGYRKVPSGPGRWVTRRRHDGRYVIENLRSRDELLTVADDIADADGHTVLDYRAALKLALETQAVVRDSDPDDKLQTVADALDAYQTELGRRSGDLENVKRVRRHLPATLGKTIVARLLPRHFDEWNKALDAAKLKPASKNRVSSGLRAALNLAAKNDRRITPGAWAEKLAAIPGASRARNVILQGPQIAAIVKAARDLDPAVGLLVEVAAQTGARVSQIGRLDVCDLLSNPPRLAMPRSHKGRFDKGTEHRPVSIPAELALALKAAAKGRADAAPLLIMPAPAQGPGRNRWFKEWQRDPRWGKSNHNRRFNDVIARARNAKVELPRGVTISALRHSSIVRALQAGTSIREVAAWHDTSVAKIETNYSRFITDTSDEAQRRSHLDLAAATVVPLPRRAAQPR